MFVQTLFSTILVFYFHFEYAEAYSVLNSKREGPVDLLKLTDITVNGYTGPMNAEVLRLFKNAKTLLLENSHFPKFEDNIYLSTPNLEKITLANCDFNRIEVNISHCCRHLKEVNLINSSLPDMPWHQLGDEWPLERVYLDKENVHELKADILTEVELKELTIKRSGLSIIDDGAFNDLHSLEYLNLEQNKIETISKRTLEPLKGLKKINLSNNLLNKLTTDGFPLLPNLEEINVGHNPIKEINLEGIKELAPKLKRVYISGIDGVDVSKNGGVTFVKED